MQECDITPTREREMSLSIENFTAHSLQRYVWASARVRDKKRVLDAACGAGYGTHMLSWVAEQVTGMDYSPEALAIATDKFKLDNNEFVQSNLNSVELNGYKYDAIVSIETLEHLSEPERFLKQCYNHLDVDGIMLLTVPNEEYISHKELKESGHEFHLRHYTYKQIYDLVTSVGFKVEESYMQGYPYVNAMLTHSIICKGTFGICHLLEMSR